MPMHQTTLLTESIRLACQISFMIVSQTCSLFLTGKATSSEHIPQATMLIHTRSTMMVPQRVDIRQAPTRPVATTRMLVTVPTARSEAMASLISRGLDALIAACTQGDRTYRTL